MRIPRGLFALAVCTAAAAPARDAMPSGYIGPSSADLASAIPPPPAAGSPEAIADREAYERAASAVGSPAWVRATQDLSEAPPVMLSRMRCATRRNLDEHAAPLTLALITTAEVDVTYPVRALKNGYRRPRPYAGDMQAKLCEPVLPPQRVETSPSYPSGHATEAALMGYVLASLLPDQAADILRRSKQYGDERAVCRVHNLSDVRAGQSLAAAVFARQMAEPRFRADWARARDELSRIAPDQSAPACEF